MPEEPQSLARGLYYKSEALPVSRLQVIFNKSGADIAFEKWLEYRDLARKDLFWLGKTILRKDLTDCHDHPCRYMFVQKNFDGVYHEDYTIGEVHQAIDKQKRERKPEPKADEIFGSSSAKDMIWLDPRGAFKSTLDGIDCVQWMINCPDIRILILTGEYKLALAFMSEIKGYFYRPEKADPSLLQQLFPEYTIRGKDGDSKQPIECPARIHNQKEPTLWCNSIDSNLSGWHCDIRKMDDVVTDENSNSPEARGKDGKLKMKIDGTDNLVDEWGFTDVVGTRYYTDDYYGERMKVPFSEAPLRLMVRRAWVPKAGFEHVPLQALKSDMVHLLFPEKLTFKSLRQKLSKNEIMFRCQQLNEPAGDMDGITFDEDMLKAHLVAQAPAEGQKFVGWDTSFGKSDKSDYSAGACGKIVEIDGEWHLYIVEVIYGRWKPSELDHHIIQFELKHKPKQTVIEEPAEAQRLKNDLQRLAQLRECPLNFIWRKPSGEGDAKRNRIKSLEILLKQDRLHFVMGAWVDEMFLQFTRFTGERKNRGRYDDIPDAIAQLQFFLPDGISKEELIRMEREREEKAWRDEAYNRIFNPPYLPPVEYQPPSLRRQLFGSLAHD